MNILGNEGTKTSNVLCNDALINEYDWCNKGRGMCYPVCGMVHIKEPLLLIGKSVSFHVFVPSLTNIFINECIVKYNISFLPSFIN